MMKTYGGPLKGGMPLYKYLGNRVPSTFENRILGMQLHGIFTAVTARTICMRGGTSIPLI